MTVWQLFRGATASLDGINVVYEGEGIPSFIHPSVARIQGQSFRQKGE